MPDGHKRSGGIPGATPMGSNGSATTTNSNAASSTNAECWDSISYLESAFHHGFMRSRLKIGDFVYHENTRLTRELDEFCDVDAMHHPKGPIIFLGESGVGKSTFLANWLVRRKKMFQNWQSSYPEFIFYHVVGCSRQSCYVSNLLERILREIKEYFELNKEIPDVEERLGWQLPRFLEAASKKGRVILIIDGLQRLRTTDGESILKWVPLAFPPNVRIIFSGTINHPTTKFPMTATANASSKRTSESVAMSSDHHEKANLNAQMIERIKLEANRRNWASVHVSALTEDDRRCIVKKFLHKHHPTRSVSTIAHITDLAALARQSKKMFGLQLFEIQQKAIVTVPMSASPLFLEQFLGAIAWATDEGFNIHVLFENWLGAESIGQLMEAILRSMETGFVPDQQGTEDANQFLAENNNSRAHSEGLHAPIRRKASDTVTSVTDKQQLLSELKYGGGAFTQPSGAAGATGTESQSSATATLSKEYSYHDSRIPSIPALSTEKTISSSVIELRYDDMQHRRSSMPSTTTTTDESSSVDGQPAHMTRMGSAHEVKEVFVPTRHSETGSAAGARSTNSQEDLGSLLTFGLGQTHAIAMQSSLTAQRGGSAAATGGGGGGLRSQHMNNAGHPGIAPTHLSQSVRVHSTASNAAHEGCGLPAYLTGGRYVSPLAELLGRALCLLYVCRHGMLTNELRFILNAIVTEDRDSATEKTQLHRKASFGSVKNLENQRLTGFSEDQWKALLRAMKPLGVLFVQDVMVLPMCKEILREVVWWRYIGSERVEQQYHQWMIRFFRIHPTTFRRVEELPWHLKRCYQWESLRNVLVNLPMFQLLYTANYKTELFGYWKTLTDGPLLVYNASSSESETASNDPPVYALPFDIVKEYGKSVDEWYKSARPPTKLFTPILQLVTKFMYEFSLYYQGYLPAFNCAPFDLKKLFSDGFTFIEDLPHVQSSSTSAMATTTTSGSSSMAASSAAATATSTLIAALESFATLGNNSSNSGSSSLAASNGASSSSSSQEKDGMGNWFFFYQRWIWIQFPWLALGKEILIREPFVSGNNGTGPGSSSGNQQATGTLGVSALLSGGSNSHEASSSHPSSLDANDAGDEEQRREAGGDPRNGLSGNAASLAPLHSTATRSAIHFDARFWDVKKSMFDSNASSTSLDLPRKKGFMSPSKINSLQNSSVLSHSPSAKTQDIISPENLFRKKSTYAAVKNVLASSIRKLPTAVANASLPLATVPEHLRASGTPSTTFLTDVPCGSPATTMPGDLGAGGEPQLDLSVLSTSSKASPATKDLVLEHLNVSDTSSSLSTAFGLPAHFQDYPQSEWDLKKSYNYQVVLKLQTLYDNMKMEVHKKQSHLQTIKKKIKETKKRYELTMRDCEMAKRAIDEMSSRMDKIEQMMVNIDKQEKNHRKLIRGCEVFSACDPSHFETMKKELKLLQMKLKDLIEEKKVLHVKKTRLQTMELPVLRKAIEKNKKLLHAVVEKLEKAREKMVHEQASTDKLYQRRLEMIDSVHSANAKGTGECFEEDESSSAQLAASATTSSLAAKVALQQCESMCEKIQKATGFSKLELILQKFVSRDELNRSFEEQAIVYEARLKQIKLHQAELEQQLHSLMVTNAVATTDDPRVLEEKLRIAEVELARTERTQNSLLTTSKEVIAGASRIVKLIGITSCHNPYGNAIPAARLWPPPLGFEGESSLSSEFETLDPHDIANLLQICQDRAGLMIDAIEGGRGDPDANYSVLPDAPANLRQGKSLRGDDKLLPRNSRPRKQHHSINETAGSEKRDRGFDRGSVPSISFPIPSLSLSSASASGGNNNGAEQPATPECIDDGESADDPVTRESIKASSRSKVVQKKARGSGHRGPGGHQASTSAVSTALVNGGAPD